MYYFTKVLVTIVLVAIIICFAFLWDYIANKITIKILKTTTGKILVVFLTMLIQFMFILCISLLYKVSFVDTLFVSCFLIFSVTWLCSYFGNYNQNQYKVINKYQGVGQADVKVFSLKLSPVLIGIYTFSILGVLFSFLYYVPYFF